MPCRCFTALLFLGPLALVACSGRGAGAPGDATDASPSPRDGSTPPRRGRVDAGCTEKATAGSLVTLASGQLESLALTNAALYWTSPTSVESIPVTGGVTTTLVSGKYLPFLAVAAGAFYVANATSILSGPTAGGVPTSRVSSTEGAIGGLAVDATNLYWSAGDSVLKAPLAGGQPTTLVTGLGQGTSSLSVDLVNVYWFEPDHEFGDVLAVPTEGGRVTTLATRISEPTNILSDGADVYLASSLSGAVLRVPLSGGQVTTLYVDAEAQANIDPTTTSDVYFGGVAVDETSVYWTNTVCSRSVMKVAKSGGAPVTLATGQRGPGAIVVDSDSAYWTTNGSLTKLTPK